jgi:16S rRNA (cytidine1402-2'-O)-methyltransferase
MDSSSNDFLNDEGAAAERPKGTLYLIPSLMGETEPLEVLPLSIKKVIDLCDHFVVENEKSARQFIKKVLPTKAQPDLLLNVLNKYTEPQEYVDFLRPCLEGQPVGIISEAGAPCVADPGSELVRIAHTKNIRVVPLVGPSSILLALMASGMNGQNFAFTGYLPIEKAPRKKQIRQLERASMKGQTQIFMETPYRNLKLFEDVLAVCESETRLCLATDITTPQEQIQTKTIAEWRRQTPNIEKRPTIFVLQA